MSSGLWDIHYELLSWNKVIFIMGNILLERGGIAIKVRGYSCNEVIPHRYTSWLYCFSNIYNWIVRDGDNTYSPLIYNFFFLTRYQSNDPRVNSFNYFSFFLFSYIIYSFFLSQLIFSVGLILNAHHWRLIRFSMSAVSMTRRYVIGGRSFYSCCSWWFNGLFFLFNDWPVMMIFVPQFFMDLDQSYGDSVGFALVFYVVFFAGTAWFSFDLLSINC